MREAGIGMRGMNALPMDEREIKRQITLTRKGNLEVMRREEELLAKLLDLQRMSSQI